MILFLLFVSLLCLSLVISLAAPSIMSRAVATRLHLGKSTSPPLDEDLRAKMQNFAQFKQNCGAQQAMVAVDAAERIPGYNLVDHVRQACANLDIQVLPVTPWGQFVPALNAMVEACECDWLVFVSAETSADEASLEELFSKLDDHTLVAGAALPGHEYSVGEQALTGRTSPWNTLAVWNRTKLALTGFQLVSEGLVDDTPSIGGIEEVVATALLQKLLGPSHAVSKLVKLPGVNWEQSFADEERRKWHEFKMQSKLSRGARQLELTGLSGTVLHC